MARRCDGLPPRDVPPGLRPPHRNRAGPVLAAALLFTLLSSGAPLHAQQPAPRTGGEPTDQEVGRFVLGATAGIFFHELGHALIDVLELPAVGNQEDVVDEFSTFVLIAAAQNDPAFYRAAVNTANFWFLQWERRTEAGTIPFWDSHGLTKKRGINILCLLYGAAPDRFGDLVERLGMRERYATTCRYEYRRKWKAWEELTEPHTRAEGEPVPDDRARIRVRYGKATSDFSRRMRKLYWETRVYERVAASLDSALALPHDIEIRLEECGTANAFWSPKEQAILMCWEMMEEVGKVYLAARTEGGGPGAASRLVGVWQGQTRDILGYPAQAEVVFEPNGEFTQLFRSSSGMMIRVWGTYRVEGNTVHFRIEGGEPKQQCGPMGCSPIRYPSAESVPFEFVDRNTVRTPNGVLRRVGRRN